MRADCGIIYIAVKTQGLCGDWWLTAKVSARCEPASLQAISDNLVFNRRISCLCVMKGMARCMKTKVQHNVLTISEMTKRPNKMCAETIDIDNIVLTEDLIRKLRASKSMFNKSTYVQILCGGVRYNVEGVDHLKNGKYRITLISPQFYATLSGALGQSVKLVKLAAIS